MKGAINYLRDLRNTCLKHKGQCKDCPLGNKLDLKDCRCPRLIEPLKWTDEMTTEMVGSV